MRTPHTSTNRGKRVRVKLKNGNVFVDKFVDKKGKYVVFKEIGRIEKGEIKAFGIYKK